MLHSKHSLGVLVDALQFQEGAYEQRGPPQGLGYVCPRSSAGGVYTVHIFPVRNIYATYIDVDMNAQKEIKSVSPWADITRLVSGGKGSPISQPGSTLSGGNTPKSKYHIAA